MDLRPGSMVCAVLDVGWRPETFSGRIVALVEQRVERFKYERFIFCAVSLSFRVANHLLIIHLFPSRYRRSFEAGDLRLGNILKCHFRGMHAASSEIALRQLPTTARRRWPLAVAVLRTF